MKFSKILILALFALPVFAWNGFPDSIDELKALPYLAWSENSNSNLSGVIRLNKQKAFDGYNLYTDDAHAYLMDMTGQDVYRWKLPRGKVNWSWYVRLLGDGSIVAENADIGFLKIDKNSKVIWTLPICPAHDIEVLADGTFLVQVMQATRKYNDRDVIFDAIVHISTDGKVLDQWSSYDHLNEFRKFYPGSPLEKMGQDDLHDLQMHDIPYGNNVPYITIRKQYDYFHLNSIQSLPENLLGKNDKRFQKGNWLISFRNVDLISILDKDTHKILWSWGPGILDRQHMPRLLNNGNILIFDNGYHRGYSRLIIVDPVSQKIVWEYKANPPESFFSKDMGSSQPLSNGDILVCESTKGHVFEITPKKQIVWEFFNPQFNRAKRMAINRMIRIPKSDVSGWLGKL